MDKLLTFPLIPTGSHLVMDNGAANPPDAANSEPRPADPVLPTPSAPMSRDGRIPKKTPVPREHYDNMNLTELQKRYRDYEKYINKLRLKRGDIERTINDLVRRARGVNIEMDPTYLQNKDEQKKCNELYEDYKTRLEKIRDKLSSKFNHTMTSLTETNNNSSINNNNNNNGSNNNNHHPNVPKNKPTRAKMSTTSSISHSSKENPASKESRYSNILLDFKSNNTWCQACDEHFTNLEQYCEHLHTRSHLKQMKKTTPWRLKPKEQLDARKTYDILKSICARLGNDFKNNFSVTDLDELLYIEPREKEKSKVAFIERERGKFRSEDPLFQIKGYDYLIPITGYYCSLCNKALCDQTEAENHLKSGDHSYAHAKSMILNPQHEKTFRTKLERSYAKLHPENQSSSGNERHTSPARPATSTSERPVHLFSYKKATSRIVDEHETIADKFQKRPTSAEPATKAQRLAFLASARRRSDNSDSESEAQHPVSAAKRLASTIPELVPLGKRSMQQPAALKRLKSDHVPKLVELTVAECIELLESDNDDVEERVGNAGFEGLVTEAETAAAVEAAAAATAEATTSQNLEPIHLPPGHPDNPFPELELRIAGGIHLNVLKDKRLLGSKVVMNRIDMVDYQHMLLDVSTLWSRVHLIMTKKESTNVKKDSRVVSRTEATFFDPIGSAISIEVAKKDLAEETTPALEKDLTSRESH